MIITWRGELVGHVGLTAVPNDYDGNPQFSNFWFDASPKAIHPDRQAVAAYLIFGSYMSGRVQMPHAFSPAVEAALRFDAEPVSISFNPIEYYPKALPIGSRVLDLSWEGSSNNCEIADSPGSAYLHILQSDRAAGSIRTVNGLTIGSNAWLHTSSKRDSLQRIYPFVAAAVLFAEDLEVDVVRVPLGYDEGTAEWRALSSLLASARLGLAQA